MSEPEFLTVKEVASILRRSRRQVYRYLKALAIPGYKPTPTSEWLIPKSYFEPRPADMSPSVIPCHMVKAGR